MKELSGKQTVMGIAFVILGWGLSWPINKLGLKYTPSILYAGIRTLIGGILFIFFLFPKWRKIQWRKNWPIYLISTFFNTIIFAGVQSIGLHYLSSGLFSVIVYLQPVFVVLLSWMWLRESLSVIKIVGMIIGFIGVVVVSLDGISGRISWIGIILALITGIGWALGTVFVKKTNDQVHGLWLVAIQNIIGGIILIGAGAFVEDVSSIKWNLPNIACMIYSGIIASGTGNAVYYKLMNSGESSKISSCTFLVPLIAVAIGTVFLSEPFTISLLGGLVLILVSIYLINGKGLRKTEEQGEELGHAENF